MPFEIPDSWAWARLADICTYIHRGRSPVYGTTKKLPIIAQKCNQWDKLYIERCLFADENSFKKYTPEQFLAAGDIIINSTGTGTVGRTSYMDEFMFQQYSHFVADSHITVVRASVLILNKYLYLFLISPLIQNDIESKCSGSTNQIELATTTIRNYLIPTPPLSEQLRIVKLYDLFLHKFKNKD